MQNLWLPAHKAVTCWSAGRLGLPGLHSVLRLLEALFRAADTCCTLGRRRYLFRFYWRYARRSRLGRKL